MISLETVDRDIAELETRDTSFATCERLAWLYIVRDHLRGYSASPEAVMELSGKSEFLQAVNGKPSDAVMQVMDQLMDAVKVLHPQMYDKVLAKLRNE